MRVPGSERLATSFDNMVALINPKFYDENFKKSITLEYDAAALDVKQGNFFAVKGTNGKYIPLMPCEAVSSASGTTITMASAASAAKFDPTDDDVATDWNQEVSFLDVNTGLFESNTTGTDVQATVASVSTTDITLDTAFAADPAATDLLIMGGMEDGSSLEDTDIVFITSPIPFTDLEGDEVGFGYSQARIDYDKLPDYSQRVVAAFLGNTSDSQTTFKSKFQIENY